MAMSTSAREEWRLGWKLVLAAMLGFSFQSVMMAAIGLFIGPLTQAFAWTRVQASMGISMASVAVAVLSPFFGALIDRWGARRIALPGLALASLSFASFSLANGSMSQWLALWAVFTVAMLATKSTVWAAAVSGVFKSALGLALGITMAGAAVAQIVTPLITNALIESYGWRVAFAAVGLAWGSIAFVAVALFLFDARDRRVRAGIGDAEHAAARLSLPGLSLGEAWRDSSLWKIAISTTLIMMVTIALLVHQFPLMTEAGIARDHAAVLASLAGAMGIVGNLLTGWFIDRWRAKWVGGITLAVSSLTFLLLLESVRTPVFIALAMVINGYAMGTKLQVCSYLTARHAGTRNFGAIFGFMASGISLGAGVGPLIAGMLYDAYGDYTPLLLLGLVVTLFSAGLILSLGRYPEWGTTQQPASPAGLRAA
ncbi:MAG: MFS transporter [Pseudomonas sp.]